MQSVRILRRRRQLFAAKRSEQGEKLLQTARGWKKGGRGGGGGGRCMSARGGDEEEEQKGAAEKAVECGADLFVIAILKSEKRGKSCWMIKRQARRCVDVFAAAAPESQSQCSCCSNRNSTEISMRGRRERYEGETMSSRTQARGWHGRWRLLPVDWQV